MSYSIEKIREKADRLQKEESSGAKYSDKYVVVGNKNHYFGKAIVNHHGIGLKEADIARKVTRVCSPRLPSIT